MRVLIVTQIFIPEMGALANRLYPIARQLVEAGHEVSVATCMPNYPEGVVFPEYRGKLFLRETVDGANILRTACYTAPRNRSKWSQLGNYLSFIPAAFHSALRAGKLDVVLVSSPPLFAVIPAIYLAKLRGAKLVFDIRDLWPDELIGYGGMHEGSLAVRLLRVVERWGYRSADCIVGTTQAILDTVIERGAAPDKTFFVPNGADLELFRPLPPDNPIAREYPFGDRFVAMYSGLFGIKHGIELILETADLLREHKEIVFFLLGNGPRREALIKLSQNMGLDNVIFGGERNVREVPSVLARADVCLTVVQPGRCSKKVNSVKTFEYMACEKPVVLASDEAGVPLLEESGGGVVVPPQDARAMADAILALRHDPERRALMGERGRRFVEENYSRSVWAERLEKTMRKLLPAEQMDKASYQIKPEAQYGEPAVYLPEPTGE
jgi:colanic acid biosynthesis glycosyl transferase WcaI